MMLILQLTIYSTNQTSLSFPKHIGEHQIDHVS